MIKKTIIFLLLLVLCLSSYGCYSYVGLNEMTIVAGVAIDTGEDGKFIINFEVIDISNSSKDTGLKSIVVESEGETIFDAIRNTRNQIPDKLYFGNNGLIVISKELAEKRGIMSIMDFFLRDEECRETVHLVVSDKGKASDILKAKGKLDNITSYAIKSVIESDVKHLGSINSMELYQIFNMLLEEKRQICLPTISVKEEENEKNIQVSGMSIFKGEKLVNSFDSDESKYCLFVSDEKKGGIVAVEHEGKKFSLEISKNKSKLSYEEKEGNFRFTLKTTTEVYLAENTNDVEKLQQEELDKVISAAEKKLKENMGKIIKKVQEDVPTDIFGYSNVIYKKNPKLWRKIEKNWYDIFPNIETEIVCKVKVLNTAYLK